MNQISLTNRVWQDPIYFIAFGFGSGLMPVAPGTFGTLAAIPVYLILKETHWSFYLAFVFMAFLLGVWVSHKVSKDLGVHDYKGIVCDEVVGYLLTMFMIPQGLTWMLLGFILFRIFDIWKPYPICYFDKKIPGGFGIMLDDVLAAIPAWTIMQILVRSFAS